MIRRNGDDSDSPLSSETGRSHLQESLFAWLTPEPAPGPAPEPAESAAVVETKTLRIPPPKAPRCSPGVPLSLGISGANTHDSLGPEPLVRGIPPIRSRRGPRRRRPAKRHADKGYDYDHLRKWLHERRIRHRIARKGIESSTQLGRHHWVVERTVSWLAGCRHLHRRYERKIEHLLAFVGIATALIAFRRLVAPLKA